MAFFDGGWVPADAARVPVNDAGFLQGTAVTEQLRTFGGQLFRLDQHLQRLARSLEIVGVDCGYSMAELQDIAEELVARNYAREQPEQDLGLSIFVTPGSYPAQADGERGRPLVCLHTYRQAFQLWADKYAHGEQLATTSVPQVPQACWPAELKCRSRMHYYQADRAAADRFAGSRAVICDLDGHVLETTTANLIVFTAAEGIVTPPAAEVLPGISLAVLRELAAAANIAWSERVLTVADLHSADEVMLVSTSVCVLPCVQLDGQNIGDGQPGDVYRQLLSDWSTLVGLDIAAQAQAFL